MKIPITEWAAQHYAPPPSPFVLRKWARQGEIQPAPEKVGRTWMVEEKAVRRTGLEPRQSLIDRLRAV